MPSSNILIQLDTDPRPSVFDSVVAIDSGAERLLTQHGVTPEVTRDLVHGAIFTRSPDELRHTAIFIGGSDVSAGQAVLAEVAKSFLGPLRVSVMLDSNGANTTAAAAVLAARRHLDLSGTVALVLAGTGPVGQRAARLLAGQGASVRLASRQLSRAQESRESVLQSIDGGEVAAVEIRDETGLKKALDGAAVVISAGPPSAELVPDGVLQHCKSVQVAIDLSAVPPLGIACIQVTDKAQQRGHVICYGALGVGGTKMKIHRAAIAKLFTAGDLVLDAEEIYALGMELER